MKLPKVLLGAILVGIGVQVTTSCTKDTKIKPQTTAEKQTDTPTNQPPNCEPCPACGMG